jgi:mannose-6-phosphate isomerase-like protein (cupin superfamily)
MALEGTSPFELARTPVGIDRDGHVRLLPAADGPPPLIDGLTVGLVLMTSSPPHGGEMHPDGDEVLVLLSGRVDVVVEEGGTGGPGVELRPGQAFVVPRGCWHRVVVVEPSQLLYITPGPGAGRRAG